MHRVLVPILIIALFLFACQGGDSNAEETAKQEDTSQSGLVYYELLSSGAQSGITEPMDLIIESEEEFDSISQEHYSYLDAKTMPPDIDFDEEIVIGVFLGEQPTTGYWVRLDSVYVEGEEQIVALTVNEGPEEGKPVLQVLTQPFVLAVMEKTDKDIRFDLKVEE